MRDSKIMIGNVLDAIEEMGLPWAYMTFRSGTFTDKDGIVHDVEPPFVVYLGSGQTKLSGDDTHYWSENTYNIEYYFTEKSSTNEEGIEAAILAEGLQFEKSEDSYLEDEDVFVIYYYLN